MAFGVGKTTTHVLGQARSFTRNVGHTFMQNHDAISMGLMLGGSIAEASGVGGPVGLAMMGTAKAVDTLAIGSDVASGNMSMKQAAGRIAAGAIVGSALRGVGGEIGESIGYNMGTL